MLWDAYVGKTVYPKVERIVFVSRSEAASFMRACHVSRPETSVIPIGVDTERLLAAEPFKLRNRVVVYMGRLEVYKGLDRVVKALKSLPADFVLSIIGQGRDCERLKRVAKSQGVASRVQFLGKLPDEVAFRWLRSSCVGISLSTKESFGLFALECLAAGKPVVLGPAPGFKQLAERFPQSVTVLEPSASPTEIANAIMDASSKHVALDLFEFDWRGVAARYAEVYSSICR